MNDNFDEEGSEFENWEPKDWKDNIAILEKITVRTLINYFIYLLKYLSFSKDPNYKKFTKDLHTRWKKLGRQIKSDVKQNPEKYSLIPLQHPFVVPGGRFREMYYW